MYHEDYEPQHPMLKQMRQEQALMDNLPEPMRINSDLFEASAGKKLPPSKLAKKIIAKSDLLKFVFNKAIGKAGKKIKFCYGQATSGDMDYELNKYAYEIYEALKKYNGKEKEALENLVNVLQTLDNAGKFKGVGDKSSATKRTVVKSGGRKVSRGCTYAEMKLKYLKIALKMAGCKNF